MQPPNYPSSQTPRPGIPYPNAYPPTLLPGMYPNPPAPLYYGQTPPAYQMPMSQPLSVPHMTPMMVSPLMPSNIAVGSTIVKAASASPGLPVGWKQTVNSALAKQPITLYVGKIPLSLPDAILQKVLECCGKVQKWNRPVDAAQMPKAFGFVTYEFGISALRCMNVLPTIDIEGTNLQLKAGTKEQASLDTLAEEEKQSCSQTDIELMNDQVKQNMLAMLNAQQQQKLFTYDAQSGSMDFHLPPSGSAAEDLDLEALSEIEKFRSRQAQRDKEIEQKRLAKIQEKMKLYEQSKLESQSSANQTTSSTATKPKSAETNHDSKEVKRPRTDYETFDMEEVEAKRRRKQQVLQMLAADTEILEPQVSVKVNLNTVSTAPVKKSTVTISNKGSINQDNEEKQSRTLIPIDYTEDELKQPNNYYFPSFVDDDDELNDDISKKSKSSDPVSAFDIISAASTNALKQAQMVSMAQLKAAEIAAKISSNIMTNKSSSSTNNTKSSKAEDDIKQKQKQLVDQIPTEKNELFSFSIDWNIVEGKDLINTVMKPWIRKKVVEYVGEEEEALISFILSNLSKRLTPMSLLDELEPILDEDAEQFVVKLWRMLIFAILSNVD